MEKINLSDADYNDLILRLGEAVEALQADERLGEQVTDLLQHLDLLHREALGRIVALLERTAPALLARLLEDSVIQSILLLYNFIPQPADGLVGEPESSRGANLVQLEVPVWVPAGVLGDFPEGILIARRINSQNLLFCRLGERLHVVLNRCLDSILPLQLGRLEGEVVICPWHGCRYHLPSGQLEGSDLTLPRFPVQISETDAVRVGFGMPVGGSGA